MDIRINPKTRPSRLFKSVSEYLVKSGSTILAMFILYRPGRFFGLLSSICMAGTLIIGLRFYISFILRPIPRTGHIFHR
ncbi:MAG: hypothetical protein WDM76_00465 [Limisphaerales bacterium]